VLAEEVAEAVAGRRPEVMDARVKKLKCEFLLAGSGEEDGGGEDAGVSDDSTTSSTSEVVGTEE